MEMQAIVALAGFLDFFRNSSGEAGLQGVMRFAKGLYAVGHQDGTGWLDVLVIQRGDNSGHSANPRALLLCSIA
jgi:hypothetical protein